MSPRAQASPEGLIGRKLIDWKEVGGGGMCEAREHCGKWGQCTLFGEFSWVAV